MAAPHPREPGLTLAGKARISALAAVLFLAFAAATAPDRVGPLVVAAVLYGLVTFALML